jgi:NTP pyrophosphatase (non-canonical NTP hydrolase)
MTELSFGGRVAQWAEDRNLIEGSTPRLQMTKLFEECEELSHALQDSDLGETIDAIGDIQVVLGVICTQLKISIDDCREAAWEQIKDRKGKMVDGVFVKEVQELNIDAVQGEHEPGEYVFHEVQEWRDGLAANFRYLDRVLDDNILMFSNICTDCKESEPYTKDHSTLRSLSSDIFAAMDKMKKFLAERQKERAK